MKVTYPSLDAYEGTSDATATSTSIDMTGDAYVDVERAADEAQTLAFLDVFEDDDQFTMDMSFFDLDDSAPLAARITVATIVANSSVTEA
jgi:hypothetical protein